MLRSMVFKTLWFSENTRMNSMRYLALPTKGDLLDLEEKKKQKIIS